VKTSKFKSRKTTVDGIEFHSTKEARRYSELRLLERSGAILRLELQPRYDFVLNGVKLGFYKADFRYVENGQIVVEDVKGMTTPMYNLKAKMMRAFHGVTIRET
jgi:hypothetical protein